MPPPPLEVGLELAVVLRFVATGYSTNSFSFDFRSGQSSVNKMIDEVPQAILEEY